MHADIHRRVHVKRIKADQSEAVRASYPPRYTCSFNASRRASNPERVCVIASENVALDIDFILDSLTQLIEPERELDIFISSLFLIIIIVDRQGDVTDTIRNLIFNFTHRETQGKFDKINERNFSNKEFIEQ